MPRVLAAALWKRLAQGQIDPCYLFFGEETYLIQEYTTTLTAQILGAAPRDFNCDVFSVDNDTLEDALSIAEIRTLLSGIGGSSCYIGCTNSVKPSGHNLSTTWSSPQRALP